MMQIKQFDLNGHAEPFSSCKQKTIFSL